MNIRQYFLLFLAVLMLLALCSCGSDTRRQTDVHILVDTTGSTQNPSLPSAETITELVTGSKTLKNIGGDYGSLRTYAITGYTGITPLEHIGHEDVGALWKYEKAHVKKSVQRFHEEAEAALAAFLELEYIAEQSRLYSNIQSFLVSLPKHEKPNRHVVYLCTDLFENSDVLRVYRLTPEQLKQKKETIKEQFAALGSFPSDNRITVVMSHEPASQAEDELYHIMYAMYKELFIEAGIQVQFLKTASQ